LLKQRIITALVLAPLVLAGVFLLPVNGFAVFIGLIILVGAWEWGGLCGYSSAGRLVYAVVLIPLMGFAWWLPWELSLMAAMLWWLLALMMVSGYSRKILIPGSSWVIALIGIFVLIPPWIALIQLKHGADGHYYILMLLLLIWGADIGAFFFGRALGRNKLAPLVSPGKSWEGVFGGMLVAMMIFVSMTYWKQGGLSLDAQWFVMMLACGLVVCQSVLGDLTESLFKREKGIKDSSQLLPGHGGVLDRIDSLVAAAPLFALFVGFLR